LGFYAAPPSPPFPSPPPPPPPPTYQTCHLQLDGVDDALKLPYVEAIASFTLWAFVDAVQAPGPRYLFDARLSTPPLASQSFNAYPELYMSSATTGQMVRTRLSVVNSV
jgi:hypothetical protein